ncbi:MAG: rRNA maturation RNase YbeY [Bacteroidetes bacterium QS_9_68_14]|nr:MAG: rRNA maturation RNase YbeY [Bacteroidetes bacterium QS_9_68_14]
MRNGSYPPEREEATLRIEEAHPGGRTLDTEALRALLTRAAAGEDVTLRWLTVVLAGRERVLRLNREHLGHDYPTDVLAFPFAEKGSVVAGEVYVDLDTAAERHEEFGATPEQEARRYALHGLLHLAGYRDKTDAGRRRMRALEDRYLSAAASPDDDA